MLVIDKGTAARVHQEDDTIHVNVPYNMYVCMHALTTQLLDLKHMCAGNYAVKEI